MGRVVVTVLTGGLAVLGAVLSPGSVPVAAAQSGPAVTVILNRAAVVAGESVNVDLAVVPASDATGDATATMDGLGVTADTFVQRFANFGYVCRPATGCTPCPAGERCLVKSAAIDVRTPPGPHAIPFVVTDSRGRTTRGAVAIEVLPPADRDADGMPDVWEGEFGLRADTAAGDDGASGDPDGDGASNLAEFRAGTTPKGRYRRYFAEASSGDREPGFEQCFRVAADRPDARGSAWITLIGDGGRLTRAHRGFSNAVVSICPLNRDEHPADRVVAAMVESDAPFVVERRVFTRRGTGVATILPFASAGVPAPSTRWLFADGGTDGPLDTFYLAYNPGSSPVEATFTYRDAAGVTLLRQTRVLEAGQRTTIWVNADASRLGRVEASTDVSATGPILVERSWRRDPPGRTVTQPFATPGTDDASSRWIFPDVDGQAQFETAIVVANPDSREALLDVTLLYADREPARLGQLRVAAGGRATIPARRLEGLAGTRASVEIISANGVRVTAERTLSGQDSRGQWRLATIGARASGTRWTVANLEGHTEDGEEVVITNVSDVPARVELSFNASYSYSDDVVTTVDVPARRRLVYPLRSGVDRLPWVAGTLRVTSQPTDRGTAEVVVEALTYQQIDGDPHARGAGLIGGRIQ
jgi:hypothetical protein